MIALGVALAGGVGAVLRYLVSRAVQRRVESDFPYGTLVANVTGCLLLGLLTSLALHHGLDHPWETVCGTGLVGAYTTFSTFSLDTVRLARTDGALSAFGNVAASLVLGIGAASAGIALGAIG